jgi:Flp pilus assembly pilin Flp
MMDLLKRFLTEEDGLGTVEIVVILAVLVSIALIFRKQVINFVTTSLASIFGDADTSVEDGGSTPTP